MSGDHTVELDPFLNGPGQTAGHAQEKLLGCLEGFASFRIAQQIAVVNRAKSEVFEKLGTAVVDSVVQFPCVGGDKRGQIFGDQAMRFARRDGL